MTDLLRMLSDGDPCSLLPLIGLLNVVGQAMVRHNPSLQAWGWRCAAIVLVGFAAYLLLQERSIDAEVLLRISVRALFAAGFTLGTAWIVLPFYAFGFRVVVAEPRERLAAWRAATARESLWREQERLRQLQEEARKPIYDPNAEVRARRELEAQKRREEARARCDVLFALHGPELRERFTIGMYDSFVERHLHDGRAADYVEQRARELADILQKHLEKAIGKRTNLAELANWFLEEKKQVEQTALSRQDKELLIGQLEERYVKLQEKYLRSVNP